MAMSKLGPGDISLRDFIEAIGSADAAQCPLSPWQEAWELASRNGGGAASDEVRRGCRSGEVGGGSDGMRYWPERVTAKCREDRSLALAHELDRELFPGLREKLREEPVRAAIEDETASDLPYDTDTDEEDDEE